MNRYDVILAGGGLANGLIAWRLLQARPHLHILIIERGAAAGGNHTWSFYDTDLKVAQRIWLTPMVAYRWPGYSVKFSAFTRRLATPYNSITSASFQRVLKTLPGLTVITNATVTGLSPQTATLDDGRNFTAPLVIDGRGYRPSPHLQLRWQKFVGLEVTCPRHGLTEPVIMDATVPQTDGYRFIYTLPLTPDRLLIEDTRYSDHAALNEAALQDDIAAYATQQGWAIAETIRVERGVLPITLTGDSQAFWRDQPISQPHSGLSAALFHPVTGYSLPDAVRLADLIAAQPELTSTAIDCVIRSYARTAWRRQSFLRLLNRMLFLAGEPHNRHEVLARFYRMPQGLIERFYNGHLRWRDKLRLVTGTPPVPMLAAIKAALWRGGKG